MSPEIVSIVGYCSTGKSSLAKELTADLNRRSGEHTARFLSVGNIFRLLAEQPNIPLDTPEAIQESAKDALSVVHTEVDPTSGELLLKPNGLSAFLQTHHNGMGASSLGANPHMAEFVYDLVIDLLVEHIPQGTVGIVDGRQIYGHTTTIISHAAFPVREQFYNNERFVYEGIPEVLAVRDEFDTPILESALASTEHVIYLERTDSRVEATKRVAEHIGGIIFDFKDGKLPTDTFSTVPIHLSDQLF